MRPTSWLLAAAFVLVACGGGDEPSVQTVGPVDLEVPGTWERRDDDTDEVVAQARWSSTGSRVETLQVVVGCGDEDADALTIGAATRAREGLVPTGAENAVPVEVPGLDAARRTTLTFGAGRVDDQETLRIAGLYGHVTGGLVLVELAAPTTAYSEVRADQVLGSVEVDAEALRAACADEDG